MGKHDNQKTHKEKKKPKKDKIKPAAAASTSSGRSETVVAGKKIG